MNGTAPPRRLLGPDGKPIDDDSGLLLPHHASFAAIWNAFNQTYSYRYDEALRENYENAMAMRRDPFIWACLDERYRGVTQSVWAVKPDDEEDAGQEAVAEELGNLVRKTPKLVSLFRNLEECVWYGRYGVQIAPGPVECNGIKQTGIKYHVPVNGDKIQTQWGGTPEIMINPTMRAEYDKKGWTTVAGERSPLLRLDRPELRERFLISTFERDDADYFAGEMAGAVGGVGLRSRIYHHWNLRTECLGWALNFFRKVGTLGLLIFPFEEGNPDSEDAAKLNVRQAGNRSSLILPVPRGADPKQLAPQVIAPSTAGIDSLTAMIDSYWERHIERYIVGQNMSDGKDNGSGLGGTGRSEFAASSQYLKIKGDADMLAECITEDLLKPLHRWNYPGQPFTYRFVFSLDDPKSAERLAAAKELVAMGVELRTDDVRDIGGFGKPNEDDETVGGALAGPSAPYGLGPDGAPILAPPEKPKPQSYQRDELPGEPASYDRERDQMNDQQFTRAMDRLERLAERVADRQEMATYQHVDTAPAPATNPTFQVVIPSGLFADMKPPDIINNVTVQPADVLSPAVNVVNEVQPAAVSVTNEITTPAAQVTVTPQVSAPDVRIDAPVTVNVPEPQSDDEYDIVPERDPTTGLVKRYKRVKKG